MKNEDVARELVRIAKKLMVGARDRVATLKSDIERGMKKLVKKHDMTYEPGGPYSLLTPGEGEPLDASIYKFKHTPDWKTVEVLFNDENMTYLLAGYVSSSVYDEMERMFKNLGYELVDSDGSRAILQKIGD
jgi:hypothetical protein